MRRRTGINRVSAPLTGLASAHDIGLVRIAVLGPLLLDGVPAGFGPRDRVVLSALCVRIGEPTSMDSLADAIWSDDPPDSAVKVVQGCISRLRKLLGTDAIRTTDQGYLLAVPSATLDKAVFEDKLARGRELLSLTEPERARFVLDEALTLWRGAPLSDLDGWAPGAIERHRLEELRRDAEELRLDAALRSGRSREMLADAHAMVADSPLRERRWALLALAQYQSGQQAQALRTLGQVKAMLGGELGLDPGPELVALEQAILRQEPSLVADAVLGDAADVCPYLGLVSYDLTDSDAFFGRETEVAECLDRLRTHGIVVVVGPSGSGKSSLVRAGLGAALKRQGDHVTVVVPGAHPLDALTALSATTPRSTLVIDQFEESLTVCADPDERSAFYARIIEEGGRRDLVIAIRADRLGDLSAYPDLITLIEPGLHLLGPMTTDDLRAAIESPARQAGLLLEPGLVDLLVREVEGEPGALPLLSHALRETWINREGRTLTVDGYRSTGGIRGAVARSAEDVYGQLPADHRRVLRDLVLRLVRPATDGDPVRSKLPRRIVSTDAVHEQLIGMLVDARLVTTDDGVLELAHEALVREWPRLRGWLDEDKQGQRILQHLAGTADAWESMGRPDSELYRGVRLAQAEDWASRAGPDLTPVERDFLAASRHLVDGELRAAQQQAATERRGRRRTRRLAAGLGVVMVLALVAAGLAINYQRDADWRAEEADANRLSALSRSVQQLDLSLLLAVAANDVAQTPATEDALLQVLVEHRRAMRIVPIGGHPDGAAIGGDGRWLFVSLSDRVVAWRIGSVEPATVVTDWWEASQISASPTGDLVAMQGHDDNTQPIVAVFRPDGEQVLRLNRHQIGADFLNGTGFSADGSQLYVLGQRARRVGGSQQVVIAIDLTTQKPGRVVRGIATEPDRWPSGAFADDGSTLAGWDSSDPSRAVLVDLSSRQRSTLDVARRPVGINGYVPFATGVAQLWADGEITIYDQRGQAVQQLGVHSEPVRDVEVSDDGTWAATVDDGGNVLVWDIGPRGSWSFRESLPGHTGAVRAVQATPDGSTLLTASVDGTVIAWDTTSGGGFGSAVAGLVDQWMSNRPVTVDPGKLVIAPVRPPPRVDDGFPDASMVSAAFIDPGTGDVIDTVPVGRTDINTAFGSSVSLSPDKTMVAITSTLATTVLDVATRQVVSRIELPVPADWDQQMWEIPAEYVWCSEWSADGKRLLIGAEGGDRSDDGAIVVADPLTGEVMDRVELDYAPQVIRRSPDGSRIAVARALQTEGIDQTPTVDEFDADTLEFKRSFDPSAAGFAFDLAYSPDGSMLAIGGLQGALAVFDTDTATLLRAPTRLHDQFIQQVEWLPGGTTVVTTGPDGKAALYDTYRGVVRTSGLPGSDNGALGYTYALSATEDEITVITGAEAGRRYPMDPARWRAYACTVAGTNLTEDQWASYLPDRPYEKLC